MIYRGKTYPFYRTNRGNWDFEAAGFTTEGITRGSVRDMLALIYFTVRDCARRAGLAFTDTLDEFVDNTPPDVTDVFIRLAKQMQEEPPGKPATGEPEPEIQETN